MGPEHFYLKLLERITLWKMLSENSSEKGEKSRMSITVLVVNMNIIYRVVEHKNFIISLMGRDS